MENLLGYVVSFDSNLLIVERERERERERNLERIHVICFTYHDTVTKIYNYQAINTILFTSLILHNIRLKHTDEI